MKQLLLAEKIGSIRDEIMLLLKYTRAAEITDAVKYPETYAKLTSDASVRAEKIACELRHILYNMPDIKKAECMPGIVDAQGIKVTHNQRWLKITLPILLSRKGHKNSEFLTDPLFYALSEHTMIHSMPVWEQTVICFRHVYDRNLPDRHIRDYDNLEEKQVLDVIALFTMIDDTGRLCDVFNTTAKGDSDYTEIFVMAPDDFLPWLNELEIG